MSKNSQRRATLLAEQRKRYEHGKKAGQYYKKYGVLGTWYPHCMAWRAGFLQNGGKRVWEGQTYD